MKTLRPEPVLAAQPGTFWDEYLHEHRSPANRWMHVAGTALSWALVAVAVAARMWWLLLFVPVAGYAFAWSGHAWIERNRPMTLRDPWRSLCCDYRLTWLILTGRSPAVETRLDRAGGDNG